MKPLMIYNIFPRLYRSPLEWIDLLDDIVDMGFNSVFVNNLYRTDSTGCLYAISDYFSLNEIFFDADTPYFDQLDLFIDKAHQNKLKVIFDLTLSCVSIESEIVKNNPQWFYREENGHFTHPSSWISGNYISKNNLALINYDCDDRLNLWNYIKSILLFYIEKGVDGFRFESAYRMPNELWDFLINEIKKSFSDILFIGETLGCTPVHIQSLAKTGFDYIYNSSKWWDYNESWCLEQYEMTRLYSPSISFPGNHDTSRYHLKDTKMIVEYLRKLYFAAVFSGGFLMTSGFEYGYSRDLNTITTTPEDREVTGFDFRENVKRILGIKRSNYLLSFESKIEIPHNSNNEGVLSLLKVSENESILILVNKSSDIDASVEIYNMDKIFSNKDVYEIFPSETPRQVINNIFSLKPAEIKIVGIKL